MASANDPELRQLYRTFITGCHILHYHQVLDAYGHLSVRHPRRPEIFIMSRYIAPATISSERDLIEYYVDNAEPVDAGAAKGYSERCIHSEIYKMYPEVNSVVHSHSQAVVPYSISGVPLRACFHMGGFIGTSTPTFDVAKHLRPTDLKDMLIRNTHLGSALASYFASETTPSDGMSKQPVAEQAVVLMRGHGFTTQGSSIQECVLRAIYTQQNAQIQTTTLMTHSAFFGNRQRAASGETAPEVHYLDEEECRAATDMTKWSAYRPWGLWVREVEAHPLYVNQV